MAGLDPAGRHAQAAALPAGLYGRRAEQSARRARRVYGSTLYRIHGSNQPWTIGQAVSSGCIRMTNDDVSHLYDQVTVGTKVVVQR